MVVRGNDISNNEKRTKKRKVTIVEQEQDLNRFAGSSEDEDDDKSEHDDNEDHESFVKQRVPVEATADTDSDDDLINVEDEFTPMQQPAQSGMSAAMARILGAPIQKHDKSKSSVVLSKTTTPLQRRLAQEKQETKLAKEKRKANRERNLTALHMPLSVATTNAIDSSSSSSLAQELQEERLHRRVATRGVVALFNAIAQHQQQGRTEDNNNATTTKKATPKLTKHGFLDMIKSKAAESSSSNKNQKEVQTDSSAKPKPKWNALQDDFMLNSKLKDWDKESSSDEDDSGDEANVGEGGKDWGDNDNGEEHEESLVTKKQRVSAH